MPGSHEHNRRMRLAVAVGLAAIGVAVAAGVVAGGNFGAGDDVPTGGRETRGSDRAAKVSTDGPFVPRPGSGPEAPEFDLGAFDGSGRVRSKDFAGQPLVLNFWASWCPFCIDEMPAFERVHQRFRGTVAFLGVDLEDDPVQARTLADRAGVTYTLAVDDGKLFRELDGRAMPTTVLISADGHIVDTFAGGTTSAEELARRILNRLIRPEGS